MSDEVERAYLERLPLPHDHLIEGVPLTVLDAGHQPILVFVAVNQATGLCGSWVATSDFTGHAVTLVLGGAELTAEFSAELSEGDGEGPPGGGHPNGGTVAGSTGVNRFHGPYHSGDDGEWSIAIGPLATSRRTAPEPELAEQEQYPQALGLVRSFPGTGDRLDFYREGGTTAVTFHVR